MFIWRSLLELPENHAAFCSLVDKGTHSAFVRLHEHYPIKSRKLLRILQRLAERFQLACVPLINLTGQCLSLLLLYTASVINEIPLFFYRRILSALAHWSAVFGETEYLPLLVFPFVKLFQNNQLICFEVVATVLGRNQTTP